MDKINSGNHVCPLVFHSIPLFVLITILLNLLDAAVCYVQSVQRHTLKLLNVEERTSGVHGRGLTNTVYKLFLVVLGSTSSN
ncbi:hypothetical protein EV702DRAFT_1094716, partial [Suillus placidus]